MATILEHELTPLGAAIVEAMPDRNRVRMIKQRFKRHKLCPPSVVFSAEQLEAWYRERGETIKANPQPPR